MIIGSIALLIYVYFCNIIVYFQILYISLFYIRKYAIIIKKVEYSLLHSYSLFCGKCNNLIRNRLKMIFVYQNMCLYNINTYVINISWVYGIWSNMTIYESTYNIISYVMLLFKNKLIIFIIIIKQIKIIL